MSRAGRHRRLGRREPNGQLSRRDQPPAEASAVAKAARRRIHGIAEADVGTELAGSAVGRMLLAGLIARRHFDAAEIIGKRHAAYSRAIALSTGNPHAVDIHGVRGASVAIEQTAEQCATAIERWDEIVDAMDSAGRRGHLYGLVFDLIISDREPRAGLAPMYRAALDAVADRCGLPLDKATEAA